MLFCWFHPLPKGIPTHLLHIGPTCQVSVRLESSVLNPVDTPCLRHTFVLLVLAFNLCETIPEIRLVFPALFEYLARFLVPLTTKYETLWITSHYTIVVQSSVALALCQGIDAAMLCQKYCADLIIRLRSSVRCSYSSLGLLLLLAHKCSECSTHCPVPASVHAWEYAAVQFHVNHRKMLRFSVYSLACDVRGFLAWVPNSELHAKSCFYSYIECSRGTYHSLLAPCILCQLLHFFVMHAWPLWHLIVCTTYDLCCLLQYFLCRFFAW